VASVGEGFKGSEREKKKEVSNKKKTWCQTPLSKEKPHVEAEQKDSAVT